MNAHSWHEWFRKQMVEFSQKLGIQGYSATDLNRLTRNVPQFRRRFQELMEHLDVIAMEMEMHPERFHFLSSVPDLLGDFLEYSCLNRGDLLDLPNGELAETA